MTDDDDDFLDEMEAERTVKNPAFPRLIQEASARAEGYAAAVADVVAWLERKGRLLSEPPKTDARRNSASCLFIVAGQIQDGAHVGAAKKGG